MKKKRYKVGNDHFDIPENEVGDFLKDNPHAIEVRLYDLGGTKYNIPIAETDAFENDMGIKKKSSLDWLSKTFGVGGQKTQSVSPQSDGLLGGVKEIGNEVSLEPTGRTLDKFGGALVDEIDHTDPAKSLVKNYDRDVQRKTEEDIESPSPTSYTQRLADIRKIKEAKNNLPDNLFPTFESANHWLYQPGKEFDATKLTDVLAMNKIMQRKILDDVDKQHGNFEDIVLSLNKVNKDDISEAKKGAMIDAALNNPLFYEKSRDNAEFGQKYDQAKFDLYRNYPSYAQKKIGEMIGQKLEDKRMVGWLYANPNLKKVEKAVDMLKEDGVWGPQEQEIFEQMKPVISAGGADKLIPLPDVMHQAGYGMYEGAKGVEASMRDIVGKVTGGFLDPHGNGLFQNLGLMESNEDRTKRLEQENYATSHVIPKRWTTKFFGGAANFAGQMTPLILGEAAGVPTKLNLVLNFEGHNADRSRELFPNDAGKQNLYTLLGTTFDAFAMEALPTKKAFEGFKKFMNPEIEKVVKSLSDKSITEDVARKMVLESAAGYLKRVGVTNTTTAGVLGAYNLAHNGLDAAFGKRNFNVESELNDAMDNYATNWLNSTFLSGLAAHKGAELPTNGQMFKRLADNPDYYRDLVTKNKNIPESDKTDMLEKLDHLQVINSMLSKRNLKPEQQEKYLNTAMQQYVAQKAIKESPDKALAKEDERKVKIAEIEKEHILTPMSNTTLVETLYDYLPKGSQQRLNTEEKFDKNKVTDYLKFIAQQSNGLDENWKPHEDGIVPRMADTPNSIKEAASKKFEKEIEAAQPKEESNISVIMPEENKVDDIVPLKKNEPETSTIPVEGKENVIEAKLPEIKVEKEETKTEDIGTEDNTDTILEKAQKKGSPYAELAKAIKGFLGNVKTTITNAFKSDVSKHGDYGKGEITINNKTDQNKLHIFFHEALHHITNGKIAEFEKNPNSKNLKPHEVEAIINLKRIFKNVTEKLNKDEGGYGTQKGGISPKNMWILDAKGNKRGLANVHEFISEAFTNPEFQKILKDFKGEGKSPTLFKQFLDAVAKMLGLKDATILDDIFYHTEKLAEKKSEKQSNETIPEGNKENKQGNLSPENKEQPEGTPPEDTTGATEGEGKPEGITHAAMQETTRKAGLPDYEGHTPVTHEERIAAAKEALKENPNLHNEIMQKVEKGGDLTPQDNAVLAVYKGSLDAELEANPSKELFDRISRIAKVLNPEGTYAGQLLESRKLVDFNAESLSNFLLDKEAAQSAPLTDKQVKDETAKFTELKQAKEELEKQLAEEKKKNAELIAQHGINKAKAIARKQSKKSHEEYVQERKASVDAAKEALKKIREGSLKSTFPGIAELKAITPHVKEFMRSLLNEGADKFDNIVSAIHAEFKDVLKGITKSDIIDIISGVHDEKKATRNDKAKTIHLLKREAQLLRELAKARKGEPKNETVKAQKDARIKELEDKIKEVRNNNSKEEPIDDTLPFEFTDDELANHKEQEKLRNKIKSLEDDIKNKKYAQEPEVKPVLKMDRKTILLKDKVIELEDKIRLERAKDEYKKRNKWLRAWDKVMEILGVRRIVQTAVDLSIPFRQGITLLGNRKAIWAKSFGKMITSFANPKKYARLMYDIRHSEDYHDMVKDGIVFNELNADNPNVRNEDFQRSFIYKIPIVSEPLKASNRAADAFLNIARYEMYMKLKDNLERQGITRQNDPKAYEFAANWAMNMTGRGKMIDALENPLARTILGNTFYGARLMASRFNLLNPITYFDPRTPKHIRLQAMKDMLSFTGTIMASGLALAAAGGKISLNPWDSDFLQVRFGNKVYDLSGGLVNYVRTGLRLTSAAYTRVSGNKYAAREATGKAGKSLLNFFRNKLSPNTSYATDWFFGKSNGQDFDPKDVYRIYPMYADDVKKALKDDGAVSLLTVLLPNLLGVGYGNYHSKGEIDQDIDDLLERNLRTDELDKSKIKNFNDGGREINNSEFKKYIDQRDAEIKKGVERLYKKGAVVIENGNVTLKPYKDLTKEQVIAETSDIKANATRKVKKALFGEKEDDEDENKLEKERQEMRLDLFPEEYEKDQ